MPDFEWYESLGEHPVRWSEQGDEWAHSFMGSVPIHVRGVSVGGMSSGSVPPWIEATFRRDGTEISTVLLLGEMPDRIVVFAAGRGEPDHELLNELANAVRAATRRLGNVDDEFPWTALIGDNPDSHRAVRLVASATVGPLQIESTDVVLHDVSTLGQISLYAWSPRASIPLRVRGNSRGYAWEAAKVHAARDLRTLCGLLSMAWNNTLIIRDGPSDTGETPVPAQLPWHDQSTESLGDGEPSIPAVSVPPWIDHAWRSVEADASLRDALDAFLEGVLASPRHPSLAAVSFVACIETIGTTLYDLDKCPGCGASSGFARLFRATLREVLSEADATALDAVYNLRSRTVHVGKLHGGETAPGVGMRGLWSIDPERDFRWSVLMRLRAGAARLLERSLTQPTPPSKNRLPCPTT